MSADIKPWTLQSIIAAEIPLNDYIASFPIPVIQDDGTKKDEIEETKISGGAVFVVGLPFEGDLRDQRGSATISDTSIAVMLEVNQKLNNAPAGLQMDPIRAHHEMITQLRRKSKNSGAEFLKIEGKVYETLDMDDGTLIFITIFSKELTFGA